MITTFPVDLNKHIGISWCADPCDRKIFFRFRNAYNVAQIKEKFIPRATSGEKVTEIGKREESSVMDYVSRTIGKTTEEAPKYVLHDYIIVRRWDSAERYGIPVHHFGLQSDENWQIHLTPAKYPWVSGYLDGIKVMTISDETNQKYNLFSICEIKTVGRSTYDKIVSKSHVSDCATKSLKPAYYAQCELYMHFTGIHNAEIHYAPREQDGNVIVSDTFSENIVYDQLFCENLLQKLDRIIVCGKLPERNTESQFCHWCEYAGICNAKEIGEFPHDWPVPTCRTCVNWMKCTNNATNQLIDGVIPDYRYCCDKYVPMYDLLPPDGQKLEINGLNQYLEVSDAKIPDKCIITSQV